MENNNKVNNEVVNLTSHTINVWAGVAEDPKVRKFLLTEDSVQEAIIPSTGMASMKFKEAKEEMMYGITVSSTPEMEGIIFKGETYSPEEFISLLEKKGVKLAVMSGIMAAKLAPFAKGRAVKIGAPGPVILDAEMRPIGCKGLIVY